MKITRYAQSVIYPKSWSVIRLDPKKCIRCQGDLQIDGGCVAQGVKGRIASRTYTKKGRMISSTVTIKGQKVARRSSAAALYFFIFSSAQVLRAFW